MESQRSFLFIALMVVTYLLFSQWQADNAPVIEPSTESQQTMPSPSNDNGDFVPESSATVSTINKQTKAVSASLITVTNDVLSLKIDTKGGDIVEAKLFKFDTEQGNGIPYTMLRTDRDLYVAQSGLTGAQGLDRIIPGRPIYQTAATSYQATANEPLVIDLNYIDETGLSVIKRFTLNHDSYAINVEYIITNNASTPASVQMYAQLKQTTLIDSGSGLIPTYKGAAFSTTEDVYEKYDFDDIADKNLNVATQGGWVAMLEHYFVSAWVPEKTATNQLYTSYTRNNEAVIGYKAPAITIEPHSTASTSAIFYVGPKDQDVLESIEENLDLTIDYGFLFMISQPLFWLLIKIQSIVSNWGVAIIIITLIVKGAMYPLTKAQYTSMAKMRALQPKMTQLKERFGDDKQKMSQAMMELYRKEKVNPAGGCLPLIIQMPIFLALYWVFLESVELRHAPFMLWIQDLSAQDPYYILPILMGISMFIMQKMQPMTVQDPMQQKIMQYMPVMFTVFFFWFPSGLVLYWLVSNIISIIQMKIIFAGIEKAKAK
ncbi:protein translocase subunit yidC [Colwellia chukchiensis]|uniref:Membrane protein insertase YidC n=1 Tax=Colwellia chukchiensis TaxID=641665 RepID=A0A1H7PGN0_9GAMM|nr:membrane protein insertase YidC [Colwellia chukchiensis]SEL34922.1 protein translocase subunit yidC [Colwellia chukchiensis]